MPEATKKKFGIKLGQIGAKDEDDEGRAQDALPKLPLQLPPELWI